VKLTRTYGAVGGGALMRSRSRAAASLEARVVALLASFSGPKVWFDPSDISTLSQDSAGTTPVAAAGDGIGRIMDKSGAGNHATQTTTPSRPLWQTTYAAFDGTDDSWATPSVDFTSTNKVTVVAGVRKNSDAATGALVELSPNAGANAGAFYLLAPGSAGPTYGVASRGSATASITRSGYASPVSSVLTCVADIAAPSLALRVDTVEGAVATSQGTGNFGNYSLYIGRRNNASLPFNGNLYGLIIIGRLLSPDEMWVCERYMAQQAGIAI
jgi:hypothetical protein